MIFSSSKFCLKCLNNRMSQCYWFKMIEIAMGVTWLLLYFWGEVYAIKICAKWKKLVHEGATTFLRVIIVKWPDMAKTWRTVSIRGWWEIWVMYKFHVCMLWFCFWKIARNILRVWFKNRHIVSFNELSQPRRMIRLFAY